MRQTHTGGIAYTFRIGHDGVMAGGDGVALPMWVVWWNVEAKCDCLWTSGGQSTFQNGQDA